MEKKLRYLVPWDFTNEAENALRYAIRVSSETKADVIIELIHVLITSGPLAKNRLSDEEAQEKINDDGERIKQQYGVDVKTTLLHGKLFDVIGEYAAEIEASFVFMGTHGIKGMQKLTGSWALKIIAGADAPFIVVQNQPQSDRVFKNIVVPLGFRDEDKEKIQRTVKIARLFGSKIHLITPNTFDSGVQKKINFNLTFSKQRFEEQSIPFEIHSATKGRSFPEDIVSLALEVESDLILIMTTPNIDFTDYVFGVQEQYIIANSAKIAVMCINPGALHI